MKRAEIEVARFSTLRAIINVVAYFFETAIIAAGFLGLADAALMIPVLNPAETPLWPPTGLALSLVLLRGYRVWPALLVGSTAAGAVSGRPMTMSALPTSAFIGIGVTLAAVTGAWMTDRWAHGRKVFATPPDIAKFVLIAAITAAIGASFAVARGLSPGILGLAPAPVDPIAMWSKWAFADAVGIILIVSIVLLWTNAPLRSLPLSSWAETVALVFLAAAIGFVAGSDMSDLHGLLPYRDVSALLVLLPLTWAGLRGHQWDAAAAALAFCAAEIWGLSAGAHSLPAAELNRSLLSAASLSAGLLLVSLVLGATVVGHRDTEARSVAANGQMTAQLEQTRSAFGRLKRHFDIFLESVADHAIILLDRYGHVANWNRNAERIIGYKEDDIVGQHFGLLYRPDERRSGEPDRALQLATQNGAHEVEGWRVRKNGTPFFVTGRLTAIRSDDGNLIGFAHVLRDATERRDAQEKLVEAREQLVTAQKMEAIGKLTGGIAHDFNNLLMIIGGNAQIFKRLLDPKLPRAIDAIQTAAKRGESLTRQLLTFSRRQHLSPTLVNLKASMGNMRTLIESSLRGNIVYNEHINPDVWPIKVDIAELELAIVNLAVNARDAMPNGGDFTLRASNVRTNEEEHGDIRSEDFVALEFADTGMGIPPSLLSKIFDPFFTTKEVGKGTGLGLSQVYGFAHQAGGTVQAESTVGTGTTITIYLPSCAGEELADDAAAKLEAAGPPRPIVLVVDDSIDVAEVTSSLFEQLGYDTVYRESADAALNLLADGANVDLVFSDIVMPGTMDGVSLANELRSRYPTLPVILTTGYSDAAKAAPPDLKIIHKPFDSDTLLSVLRDSIAVR
jgi:PAS domain S-box-containing protein